MDKEYIIIKTMARFSISYHNAKTIINDLEKREELEDYVKHLEEFPTYHDLKQYYYGGKNYELQ